MSNEQQVVSDYEQLKEFLGSFIDKDPNDWSCAYMGEMSLQDLKKLRELVNFSICEKLIEYSPTMFGDFVKMEREYK